MLPVNDMMLFVDVVRYKSFTTAAQKNGLTPAGVSKRISKLEALLEVNLLTRTTRSLAVTDAGSMLYAHCQSLHIDLKSVVENLVDIHKHPKGVIKISALQNVSNIILAPLLQKFMKKYKDIEIVINLDGALGPLPPIGEYDIAFRSGKLLDSSAVARLFFSHNYVVCASPEYFKQFGIPQNLSDLKAHNCIDCRYTNTNIENAWVFFKDKERFCVPVKGNISTDNALLVKNIALNNLALIYSPSFLVAEEVNSGKLIPVLTQYETLKNAIYIVHPYTNKNIPRKIKTFIDYLVENLTVPLLN